MHKYGDLFGDNPPQNLEELVEQMQRQMAQMQNLLDSLPADMRQQLQDLLMDKIGDPELRDELADLAANLEYLYPQRDLRNQYPFRGDEELDLNRGDAPHGPDAATWTSSSASSSARSTAATSTTSTAEKLRELLGEEAAETLDQLKQFLEILEEAGYIRKRGNNWELTPRGTRKIGQKALGEIYSQLKKEQFGKHKVVDPGRGGERADDTKTYEFGDPFHLHLEKTIMNAAAPRRRRRCRCSWARTTSRSTEVGAAHADRDRDDGRPLVVDGAARQLPGGEEGRAGAATT